MAEKLSPGELLNKAIERSGMGPKALADRIGVGYQTIYRWTVDKNFNEENQKKCARALGLPPDHFADAAAVARRGRGFKEAFNAWRERSPYARELTEEEESWLHRLPDGPEFKVISDRYFDVNLGMIRGNISFEIAPAVMAKNEAIDAAIAAEDSVDKPRKRPGPKRKRKST